MTEVIKVFPLPPHTVLETRTEGTRVFTTVILAGEIMEFEICEATRRAVEALYKPSEEQSE